jgi:hypothetical protein
MTNGDYIRAIYPEYANYTDEQLSREFCPDQFDEFVTEACHPGSCIDHWKQEYILPDKPEDQARWFKQIEPEPA